MLDNAAVSPSDFNTATPRVGRPTSPSIQVESLDELIVGNKPLHIFVVGDGYSEGISLKKTEFNQDGQIEILDADIKYFPSDVDNYVPTSVIGRSAINSGRVYKQNPDYFK